MNPTRSHGGPAPAGRAIGYLLLAGVIVFAVTCLAAGEPRYAAAPGAKVMKLHGMTVDYSAAGEGYVCVRGSVGSGRLKLRVAKGDTVYTYDLPADGEYQVFPLQMGSGAYSLALYEQVSGSRYAALSKASLDVALAGENLPYLYPNQYVPYGPDTPAVKISLELCRDMAGDREKVQALWDYVTTRHAYDHVLALTAQPDYLPDLCRVSDTGMGICLDFAALFACMLRVQDIPAQLVVGHADDTYHAWNNVYLDGAWARYDPAAWVTGSRFSTYTEERRY